MSNISKTIDHTILKANATKEEVKKVCNEAKEYNFASVCVNPKNVPLSYQILKDTDVKVCTVVGFPLGANQTQTKVFETNLAISEGATEIDMVIDVGAVKDGDWDKVSNDISEVRKAVKSPNILKVIIETCLLTNEEKEKVCTICKEAKVDFVKTSTGFSTGGATIEDVKLMHKIVGPEIKVKASGGVRTLEDAQKMLEAGASRLGTSNGISIVKPV